MFSWIQKFSGLWPVISAVLAAWLGVQYNETAVAGVATAQQSMGMGALTFGTGISLFLSVISNWKKAGGKLDGKATAEELAAIGDTILPGQKEVIDKLAPQAAALVNLLGGYITKRMSAGGLNLPFGANTVSDVQHRSLTWSLVDALAMTLQGDVAGEDAVTTIRTRLDELFFPGTKQIMPSNTAIGYAPPASVPTAPFPAA